MRAHFPTATEVEVQAQVPFRVRAKMSGGLRSKSCLRRYCGLQVSCRVNFNRARISPTAQTHPALWPKSLLHFQPGHRYRHDRTSKWTRYVNRRFRRWIAHSAISSFRAPRWMRSMLSSHNLKMQETVLSLTTTNREPRFPMMTMTRLVAAVGQIWLCAVTV